MTDAHDHENKGAAPPPAAALPAALRPRPPRTATRPADHHPLPSPPLALGVLAGDTIVIEGAGAYCSSMSTKNYNSFPEAPEVLLTEAGALHTIRKKQAIDEIWANEVPYTP